MNKSIKEKIRSDFSISDYDLVVSEMESITLKYVMANSQANLDNTLSAILQLSKGDLNELGYLVDAAKQDFRDVIYWATLENEKQTKAFSLKKKVQGLTKRLAKLIGCFERR